MATSFQAAVKNEYCMTVLDKCTGQYTTLAALKLRVVDKVLSILDLSWKEVYAQAPLVFIHPECSIGIENALRRYGVKFAMNDKRSAMLMVSVLSKHHVEPWKITRFARLLDEEKRLEERLGHELNVIFAVDGFGGSHYENYVSHLKFYLHGDFPNSKASGDVEYLHVQAVRRLYKKFDTDATPESVRAAILKAKNAEDDPMGNEYIQFIGIFYNKVMKVIDKKLAESSGNESWIGTVKDIQSAEKKKKLPEIPEEASPATMGETPLKVTVQSVEPGDVEKKKGLAENPGEEFLEEGETTMEEKSEAGEV